MILQALTAYHDRLVAEGNNKIAPAGFQEKRIPFVISINLDGKLTGITDTRSGDSKRKQARAFNVPKVFEGSRTSNVEANLLWDKASYVFGVGAKTKPARLVKQREAFRNTITQYFPDTQKVKSVAALLKFLDENTSAIQSYKEWEEISTKDPNVAFQLAGELGLICNSPEVIEALSGRAAEAAETGMCLISGNVGQLARLENPFSGLLGSGKAESHWVAFNEPAYWSYGKNDEKRYLNAPISKSASNAYVKSFNYLQKRDSRQRIQVGDATTVFWAEKKNQMEDVFADIFGEEPDKREPEQDYKSMLSFFRSPESGTRVELDPNTKFYVLGLSPNAARIAVRFWYAGTVGDIAEHIAQHFNDLEIKPRPDWGRIGLRWLLRSAALGGDDKNIAPNLGGDTMRSILTGMPYPQTLLAAAIRRCRAEREITYTRAALIKAILVREMRFRKHNEKEVEMSLDITNTNPGYLLGRLFAVLEKAQESAQPGINATIRDRYYGAASGTPVAVFPVLMKLNKHHLAKLEDRQAVYFEKINSEIVGKLDASIAFPPHLSLADQGRFAVGYYHQRQDFFTKKEDK